MDFQVRRAFRRSWKSVVLALVAPRGPSGNEQQESLRSSATNETGKLIRVFGDFHLRWRPIDDISFKSLYFGLVF